VHKDSLSSFPCGAGAGADMTPAPAISIVAAFHLALARVFVQAAERGITLRYSSFWRSAEWQNALYRAKLTPCDGYEKKSKHQEWLAADLVIERDGLPINDPMDADYDRMGEIVEAEGLYWGGRQVMPNGSRDAFHVQAK
jgi:hypothetical protein